MLLKSPLSNIEIPEISLYEHIRKTIDNYGDKLALIDEANNQNCLSFNQVQNKSIKFANALSSLGICKGDVIATCFSFNVKCPIILIGAAACAAIVTPCSLQHKEEQMRRTFYKTKPKVVFMDGKDYTKIKEIAKDFNSIKYIFSMDQHCECESFEDLLQKSNSIDFSPQSAINPSNDVLVIAFTSGTTSTPKGVQLTHKNLISMTELTKVGLQISSQDVGHVIWTAYFYGMIFPLASMVCGSKLVFGREFTAKKFYRSVENHKITYHVANPTHMLKLYNSSSQPLRQYNVSSLKRILCGNARLAHNVAKKVKEDLSIQLFQGWGLTESVPSTIGSLDANAPLNSVGRLVPNTSLKIVDVNSGRCVGPNHEGELCLKGPQVTKGYYKEPEETNKCFDKEGWFYTGDIGYYDSETDCIYIVERKKQLIKFHSYLISPSELEEMLLSHPDIADVGVVGVLDHQAGEVPKAFVVSRNHLLTSDDIHRFMQDKVVPYKYLRGGVTFLKAIPTNEDGKIDRNILKTLHGVKAETQTAQTCPL